MSDFQKRIERQEKSRVEQPQATSPVEKEKREKEEGSLGSNESSKPFLFAALFSLLKNIVSIFPFQNLSITLANRQLLAHDLASFRDLLFLLCNADKSHDPDYLQKLSELWHTLLKNFNLLDLSERKNGSFLSKTSIFIKEILLFPEGEEHSLGFYMTEHAGESWIPFPFMNLLQGLHRNYQKSPEQSTLFRWTSFLKEILLILQPSLEED